MADSGGISLGTNAKKNCSHASPVLSLSRYKIGSGAGGHGQNLLCNPSGEDEQVPCWKTVGANQKLFLAGSEYPQRAVVYPSLFISAAYYWVGGSPPQDP